MPWWIRQKVYLVMLPTNIDQTEVPRRFINRAWWRYPSVQTGTKLTQQILHFSKCCDAILSGLNISKYRFQYTF